MHGLLLTGALTLVCTEPVTTDEAAAGEAARRGARTALRLVFPQELLK